MRRASLVFSSLVFLIGTVLIVTVAPLDASELRLSGTPAKTPDFVGIESGEDLEILSDPGSFGDSERVRIDGTVVLENGTPVQGLVVALFPYRENEAHVVMGIGAGLSIFNPRVASGADGKFTLVAGPLWKRDIATFACGAMVQNSPERPLDVTVLLFEGESGPRVFEISKDQREIHLGKIVVPVDSTSLKK